MGIGKNAWNPLSSEMLDASGVDYVALGHFHNRFETAGKTVTAYNPGSPEPLGFDEEGVHGVFISELKTDCNGGKNAAVRFIPLNKRSYRNISVNADGLGTDERAAEIIAAKVLASGGSGDLFSITLKGVTENSFRLDKRFLETRLKDLGFFIRLKDETTPGYDFEEISKEPGLRGLFVKKMLEKLEKAGREGDEADRRLVLSALYYGMEAMEQGEICL